MRRFKGVRQRIVEAREQRKVRRIMRGTTSAMVKPKPAPKDPKFRVTDIEALEPPPFLEVEFFSMEGVEKYRTALYDLNQKGEATYRTTLDGLTLRIWRVE